MAAYEVLLLNTAIPQIQAAQSGDTYVVPRDIAINATAIISANSATDALRITQTGAGNALLVEDSTNPDSTPFVVTAAGDVGVGPTSPATKLDVAGTLTTRASTSGAGQNVLVLRVVDSGNANFANAQYYANSHFWGYAGSSNGMTLDASGNLGLGVTPSAWSTGYYLAQQIGGGGSFIAAARDTSNELTLGTNAYFDGTNWKRTVANYATLYKASSGAHAWFNAASSTAGSTISFTQAMTLDASGNLLLGLTSGTAKFDMAAGSGSQAAIRVRSLSTNSNGFNIVTDSATDNVYLNNYYNAAMLFGTNNTERARITSGGYFKASNAGTYNGSTGAYHELYGDTSSGTIAYFTQASATSPSGVVVQYTAAAPNGTANTFLYCQDNAALRASIRSNGGLANYQSNNVDLSDIRTKTDINPLASYWNKIAALEIVTYKYKDQTHDDLNIGVIAQQVEQVAPEFVDPDGFGETPEDGVPLKTIYNKDLTFAAIKALQEAMARIEQLEAKVAAMGA